MSILLCEPTSSKTSRPMPGDLVVVNAANDRVNAYKVCPDFSFANVVGTVSRGDMGIILDFASSENGSILYHYVKVLFSSKIVGIVHYGLLHNIEVSKAHEDLSEMIEERMR